MCARGAQAKGVPSYKARYQFRANACYCARINHPLIAPSRLHCPHYCNAIARFFARRRRLPDPPFVCHTPYNTSFSSEAVLGVWLPAPLPTPRALPDRDALWPLAVGVEKDLGGIDVWPCGIVCCSLCGLTHPPSILVIAISCTYQGAHGGLPAALHALRPVGGWHHPLVRHHQDGVGGIPRPGTLYVLDHSLLHEGDLYRCIYLTIYTSYLYLSIYKDWGTLHVLDHSLLYEGDRYGYRSRSIKIYRSVYLYLSVSIYIYIYIDR